MTSRAMPCPTSPATTRRGEDSGKRRLLARHRSEAGKAPTSRPSVMFNDKDPEVREHAAFALSQSETAARRSGSDYGSSTPTRTMKSARALFSHSPNCRTSVRHTSADSDRRRIARSSRELRKRGGVLVVAVRVGCGTEVPGTGVDGELAEDRKMRACQVRQHSRQWEPSTMKHSSLLGGATSAFAVVLLAALSACSKQEPAAQAPVPPRRLHLLPKIRWQRPSTASRAALRTSRAINIVTRRKRSRSGDCSPV